ncbi:MAG: site-specific integrase [Methanoregula sp.]|nr:site-specific integrase [Methanoregula sp.]
MSPEDFVKVRPPNTKQVYTNALKMFCKSTFGTDNCSELIKYMKRGDRSQILSDLLSFRAFLDEQKETPKHKSYFLSPNSKKTRIAAVRAYLAVNEIVFSKAQVSQILVKDKSKMDDLPFTVETAKRTFDQMSHSGRATFLFLLSSGCRIGETLQIRLQDIDWKHSPVKVKLRAEITKTRTERYVFISDECADYLKTVWLPRRLEYMESAKNKNAGLCKQATKTAKKRPDIKSDMRLFPFSTANFHGVFISATDRAGLGEKNDLNMRKLHPHSTRKFFRNEMGRWGSPDSAEYLMGHEQGLTSVYRTPSNEQLVTDYKNAMPYLTIGMSREARVAIQTGNTNAAAIVGLQKENARMQEQIAILTRASVIADKIKI